MNLKELRIGRIYKTIYDDQLKRIIYAGGAGYYSGRGCKPETASPDNHIRVDDVVLPTLDEIHSFLELEMNNNMAKKSNVNLIPSKGIWMPDDSGFRCRICGIWINDRQEKRCECDARKPDDIL